MLLHRCLDRKERRKKERQNFNIITEWDKFALFIRVSPSNWRLRLNSFTSRPDSPFTSQVKRSSLFGSRPRAGGEKVTVRLQICESVHSCLFGWLLGSHLTEYLHAPRDDTEQDNWFPPSLVTGEDGGERQQHLKKLHHGKRKKQLEKKNSNSPVAACKEIHWCESLRRKEECLPRFLVK